MEMSTSHLLLLVSLWQVIDSATSPASSEEANRSEPDNGWLAEAVKDIAYYLRAHKFNEYDRRYEPDAKLARREYYRGFPRPPLRSLHWEVHKYCEESLLECVQYLGRRVRKAGLRRGDDTVVVIQEQQWDLSNNSRQIEIVDNDCRKMKELDESQANPFEGPLERFQWRVTASYYMCWYTLKSEPALRRLSDRCDNFAACLDRRLGAGNRDARADDGLPFACALHSFCPDPCCPVRHLAAPEECWDAEENPCFAANPAGRRRECGLDRGRNAEFTDIILNRWNVSCSCAQKGFEWSSFYGLCVDVDECATGAHTCDPEMEVCLNLAGGFKCACKWGHTVDTNTGKCSPSDALTHLVLQEEKEEKKSNVTIWMQLMKLFASSKALSRKFTVETNLATSVFSLLVALIIKY